MKEALVSIVMPVYNAANFLEEAVASVLSQTYQNWELILINDNSRDESQEIISKLMQQDKRVISFSFDKNVGAAQARNKAIEMAKGDFIAFLDSDDVWYADKLSLQISHMERENLDLSYSSYDVINEGSIKYSEFIIPIRKATYHAILKTNFIGCLTVIYNAKKIGKQYMPNIAKRQDMALWLKILKLGGVAGGLRQKTGAYRVRKKSISSNKWKAATYQWKIYRDVEKLSVFHSLYYFMHYMMNGILKYR